MPPNLEVDLLSHLKSFVCAGALSAAEGIAGRSKWLQLLTTPSARTKPPKNIDFPRRALLQVCSAPHVDQ